MSSCTADGSDACVTRLCPPKVVDALAWVLTLTLTEILATTLTENLTVSLHCSHVSPATPALSVR